MIRWLFKRLGVQYGRPETPDWPDPPPRIQRCMLCDAPHIPGLGTPHMSDCPYYDGPLDFVIRRPKEDE